MINNRDMARLDLPRRRSFRSMLGWPYAIAGVATAGLGLAVWGGGVTAGLSTGSTILLTLFAVTAWIALAAGPLAGGAHSHVSAIMRASALSDVSILTLAVLGIWSGGLLTWFDGLRIYLLWAALVTLASVVTQLGNSSAARAVWGMAASVLLVLAASSLFWSAGLLAALQGDAQQTWANALLAINPLAGVVSVMGPKLAFSWHAQPVMGGITRVGQDFPAAAVAWWTPVLFWLLVAAAVGFLAMLRRAWCKFRYGS